MKASRNVICLIMSTTPNHYRPMQQNKSVRYFLYVRKSTDSEDRQMASIPDQIEVMTQLAKNRGITITDIITESKSAKQPGRPAFTDMISRIKHGEADGILCWKLNRLARNPIDAGEISWMLQKSIIRHIQTHGQDYNPSDNVLMMQVEFGIANEYVKNLSVDVIRGLSMKAKRGWFPCSKLTLGYMHNAGYKLGEPEIIPDPNKFPLVKHLWELMLSGEWNSREIREEANRVGLLSFQGKPLSRSSLHRIFKNNFYAGYFAWNHGDEGVIQHKGKHAPMITLAQFNRVQILLGEYGNSVRDSKGYNFRYRGPFRCGECHGHITAEHKLQLICTECKRKFSIKNRSDCPKCATDISEMTKPSIIDKTYYRCTRNSGPCSQPGIEENDLEKQLIEALNMLTIPQEIARLISESLRKNSDSTPHLVSQKLEETYKHEQKNLENLITMRMEGEIDQTTFLKHKAELEAKLIKVEGRLQAESSQKAWQDAADDDLKVASRIPNNLSVLTNSEIKQLISEVASNPVILGRKPLFHFKKQYLLYRKVYDEKRVEYYSFEPEKSVEKQGRSGDEEGECLIRRAERNDLRTLYIQQGLGNKGDEK